VTLQVQDADAPAVGDRRDEGVVPVVGRVQFELGARVDRPDVVEPARRLEAGAHDEPDRVVGPTERTREVGIGLPERQIEGGALEGPAAVVAVARCGRRRREQRQVLEVSGEPGEAVLAGEFQAAVPVGVLEPSLVVGVVSHVFTAARLAVARQRHRGRAAREVTGGFERRGLQGVLVDDEREGRTYRAVVRSRHKPNG